MSEDFDVRNVWNIIAKRKKIIFLIVLFFLVAGLINGYLFVNEYYSATTTLLPLTASETIRISTWEITASREISRIYGALVKSRSVLESTIEKLGIELSYGGLQSQVLITYIDDTQLFQISVKNQEPELAIALTNEVAQQLIYLIEEEYFPTERLVVVDQAISATLFRDINARSIPFSVFFGFLFGIGLAFFLDYLDDSIKSARDVKKGLNLSVLGEIPVAPSRVESFPCTAPITESYRFLINNIQFCGLGKKYRSILVTPTNPRGDGVTVAANIAIMFSKGGSSVLLVDATYNKPTLHLLFNLNNEKGFLNLTGEEEIPLEEIIHETKVKNLFVMPSGRGEEPNKPAKPLSEEKFLKVMDILSDKFDYIVFNTPQLINYTDVAVIASLACATVLVVNYGQVSYEEANHAKEQLERSKANVIGVVLNNVPLEKDKSKIDHFEIDK